MDRDMFTKEEIRLIWKAVLSFLFLLAAMALSLFTSCSQEDRMPDFRLETLPLPASGHGKAALVIIKGGGVITNGTEDKPVVLAASVKKPGTWDSIILMDGTYRNEFYCNEAYNGPLPFVHVSAKMPESVCCIADFNTAYADSRISLCTHATVCNLTATEWIKKL